MYITHAHIYLYRYICIYVCAWHLFALAVALSTDAIPQFVSWKAEALVEEVPITPHFYQAGVPTQVTNLIAPPLVTLEPR